jgi:hypothetical protein
MPQRAPVARLTWRLAAVSLCTAALLAACGGGGSDAGEAPFGNEGNNFGNEGGSSNLPASSTLDGQCAADNPLAPTAAPRRRSIANGAGHALT